MTVFKYIDRINLLDKLIRQRRTGTPTELADRLSLSVSRVARIIEYLRDMGAPIAYDRVLETYYYQVDYSIQIKVDIQSLNRVQMKNIHGGTEIFSEKLPNASFVHWTKLS